MNPFRFVDAMSPEHAISLLEADPSGARPLAGGTDLMGEVKEGVMEPATLVSLGSLAAMSGVEHTADSLTVGAMTTLAELERDEAIARDYPALAQAIASVATPQIRNVGTLGGNLCQRPRCWYYRSTLFDCRKKGGAICFAVNGSSKYHAILGGVDCYIVHPSDLAPVLVALGADATIAGPRRTRTLPLEDFFVGPERDIEAETVLEAGELLTRVSVPRPTSGQRSVYLKARERRTHDFALASVAASLRVSGGVVEHASLVLGGVAPTPWRASRAEDALRGAPIADVDAEAVGWLAVDGARPLRDNHFKVRLAASLVRRAIGLLLGHNPRTPC